MDVTRGAVARWLSVIGLSALAQFSTLEACMQGKPASPGLGADASADGETVESAVTLGCPDGGYPGCPSTVPSWSTQVRPIVDVWCAPCHFNGGSGTGKGYDFSTLAGIRGGLTTSLTDLHKCKMPPEDAAVLSATDRETLIEWLVCDAPDN
jgi:hypothetical protein